MSAPNACVNRFGGLAAGKEEEQKRYFREKRLYALQVESTDACGQGCLYCYSGSTPTEHAGLTSSEIRDLLDDAASLEIRAIDWLGGDPLERRDWHELMLLARTRGLLNNVWTSGLPLRQPGVASRVLEATEGGFVSVHVDSLDPQVYARLHRGGDAHNISRIIEGVDALLALGKRPDQMINCITFTSLQPAEDAIATMRWWMREKGIRTCLTMFNPAGKGEKLRALEPDARETQLVYEERDRVNYGDGAPSLSAMDTDKFYCGTMATVTFTGDVTPCSVIRKGVGNIRHTPFRSIVAAHLDKLVHAALHDVQNMPAPCDRCLNNSHCWGCRASAHHYGGDADGLDPKCWMMKDVGARGRPVPLYINIRERMKS
jgi:radical SAM protein with 4Fe4S-binding SPASM domain